MVKRVITKKAHTSSPIKNKLFITYPWRHYIPIKIDMRRFVAIYPNKDGKIRVTNVKTMKSLFRRSIHILALLLNTRKTIPSMPPER